VTTTGRRLAKVEEALDPTGIVLRWLAEAHAYGDMAGYTRAILEDPVPPLDRLAGQARQAATSATRGRPRPEADQTLRRAVVGTVFRFKLVLRLNVVAHDVLDREALIHGALSMAAALAMDAVSERRPVVSLVRCRDLLVARVTELLAHEAAREQVERRYLRGTQTLFPATRRQWDEQVTQSKTMAVMALHVAELDGLGEAPADDVDAFERRVTAIAADLTEPARSDAYNEIGDGRRAYEVARGWVYDSLARRSRTAIAGATSGRP
jgi:hypothetical protein